MDNNGMKRIKVKELQYAILRLSSILATIDALDCESGSAGSYDLHDQLWTMSKCEKTLKECSERMADIIPKAKGE
jgi:hypothetical protein